MTVLTYGPKQMLYCITEPQTIALQITACSVILCTRHYSDIVIIDDDIDMAIL